MLVTQLDPVPVSKRDNAGEAECGDRGDGPWRAEEKDVNDEEEGGEEVEAEVGLEGELEGWVGRNDEVAVDGGEAPVEEGD